MILQLLIILAVIGLVLWLITTYESFVLLREFQFDPSPRLGLCHRDSRANQTKALSLANSVGDEIPGDQFMPIRTMGLVGVDVTDVGRRRRRHHHAGRDAQGSGSVVL